MFRSGLSRTRLEKPQPKADCRRRAYAGACTGRFRSWPPKLERRELVFDDKSRYFGLENFEISKFYPSNKQTTIIIYFVKSFEKMFRHMRQTNGNQINTVERFFNNLVQFDQQMISYRVAKY